MKQKLRMGMVGGGIGAFIGGVHRMAAALDQEIELVCGAFSSHPDRSRESGSVLGLDPARVYDSFESMIRIEKKLPPDRRMHFVSIVTPNHLHFAPAKMALENGFHVVCDKPVCFSYKQSLQLLKIVEKSGLLFALTHNYTGYPMVKQARAMVRNGDLGIVRKVVVEYPQGWLATLLEASQNKQASWRTDPTKSGLAGCIGDIGTHAENLAEYISGLKINELCADISIIVEGRQLDDDGNMLLRFDNGAHGLLHASQIATGEENNLSIRVYGEKGGLEWRQQEPNSLIVRWLDQPMQVWRTGVGKLYPEATLHTRIPAGHPEGFIEAFANIYRNFAHHLRARIEGTEANPMLDFPTIYDGVRGMLFIEKAIASGQSNRKWLPFSA